MRWAGSWRADICVVSLALSAAACQPAPQPWWGAYRFDDHLDSAQVEAPSITTTLKEAAPLVWNFDNQEVTWRSVEGMMGFKPGGELVVKGNGNHPVITSPEAPAIDWARYESIRIRMVTSGGREVKIRFEDQDYAQPLAPPGQYRIYRFDFGLNSPSYRGRLDIIPTDSASAPVAIDYIELVPKPRQYREPAGRSFEGKASDYRNALYVHSPAKLTFELTPPAEARLHVALGIAEPGKPVTFELKAGTDAKTLFSRTVNEANKWVDIEADLSEYSGSSTRLVFEARSPLEGAVAFWANPRVVSALPKQRLNVVVYMIDTLRPDHTSLYGYKRDTTPFLKKLGAEGVVFEDCQVQATWTKPSVASLMTSLYSTTHGLREFSDTIPRGATTLAEAMRANGYVTASVLANPFAGRNSGLERGFDYLFEYPVAGRAVEPSDGATDSRAVNEVLLPWLRHHHDDPLFLYVHVTDPHAPYRPPKNWEARFADPAETAQFERDTKQLQPEVRRYGGSAVFSRATGSARGIDTDRWVRQALDRYDAEIANSDHSIEELFGGLNENRLLDNMLFVAVSDHGEEFLEHGWTTHGHSLYQELTHAMLLVWSPKLLPEPRRVGQPVQMIDVMPTILELLGISTDGPIQGRSLASLALGQPLGRRGAVMTSRLAQPGTPPPGGGIPENWTDTYSSIGPKWKLIYRDGAARVGLPEVELYDRETDPGDTRNLALSQPEIAERLREQVEQWAVAQKSARELLEPAGQSTMDAATIERLRSLGYVGGAEKH